MQAPKSTESSENSSSTEKSNVIQRIILEDIAIFQTVVISALIIDYLRRQGENRENTAKGLFNAWLTSVNQHSNRYLEEIARRGGDVEATKEALIQAFRKTQPEISGILQLSQSSTDKVMTDKS